MGTTIFRFMVRVFMTKRCIVRVSEIRGFPGSKVQQKYDRTKKYFDLYFYVFKGCYYAIIIQAIFVYLHYGS